MSHLATLIVREGAGIVRAGEAIRTGVPLARGAVADANEVGLFDAGDRTLAAQFTSLNRWPDGSIKWLLVDTQVDSGANAEQRLTLRRGAAPAPATGIAIQELDDTLRIDTGAAVFDVPRAGGAVFASVAIDGKNWLARGMNVRVAGARGAEWTVRLAQAQIEERGSVRTAVVCSGTIESGGREVARLTLRLIFVQASAALRIECEIWNPRAARHVGGLWDLGDGGSVAIQDLSIELRPIEPPQRLAWQTSPGAWREETASAVSIYQDSSGGENWNSPNHIDARGKSTVTFRGFRVQGATGVLAQGERASPALKLSGAAGWICASVGKFWQNFPKALRFRDGILSVGLFPAESAAGFELQGGEKKRHTVLIEFGRTGEPRGHESLHAPLAVGLEPGESAASGAVSYLLPAADDGNAEYLRYVGSLLEGPHAIAAKRECIDEYGWRNFGDLYADHEAVNHRGPAPFISHYNNQYDFVCGAGMHYLRSGDARWRELMVDAARHLIDIDIYHTRDDKAGFSGGLFWHTDHYQPAATCTHRTYSRANARGPYGGGPSNEHNYTSGLLQYFLLTGDREAADAVVKLADWVIAMDDGARTLFGFIDDGPTGLASKTRDMDFHKPGRGAGNSINALLDAYAVTRQRRYLQYAERLIERVIHPHDDVAALGLDQPETRWSYVVFLQVLGKYLDQKLEWGETDYLFWYTRAALLTYARWMREHELPARDQMHKVELPTETWPAQDIRKCHVFHLAARYAPPPARAAFSEKAALFFDRCLADLLSYPTAHLTRPQVILCVYGVVHGYYQHDPHVAALPPEPDFDFGAPVSFEPQGARLRTALRRKVSATVGELRRLMRDRLRGTFSRFTR